MRTMIKDKMKNNKTKWTSANVNCLKAGLIFNRTLTDAYLEKMIVICYSRTVTLVE